MLCAQKGVSFKDFATNLLLQAIEEYEDEVLIQKANKRLAEMKEADLISWDEALKEAGWDADNEI